MDGRAEEQPCQRAPRQSRSEPRRLTPQFLQLQRAKRFQLQTHALFRIAPAAARHLPRNAQNGNSHQPKLLQRATARSESAEENPRAIKATALDRIARRARHPAPTVRVPPDAAKESRSSAGRCPDATPSSDGDPT